MDIYFHRSISYFEVAAPKPAVYNSAVIYVSCTWWHKRPFLCMGNTGKNTLFYIPPELCLTEPSIDGRDIDMQKLPPQACVLPCAFCQQL